MNQQKPILIFLIKFFVSYFILFIIYSTYLQRTQIKSVPFQCAPITKMVSNHVGHTANFLGYKLDIIPFDKELAIDVYIGPKHTIKIIEGCNGVSIIILFIAFIFAFSGRVKTTFFYMLFGSLLIYFANILRIILFALLLYKYPEHQAILHKLVFPALIYGLIFLLWVVWVQYFSVKSTLDNE